MPMLHRFRWYLLLLRSGVVVAFKEANEIVASEPKIIILGRGDSVCT